MKKTYLMTLCAMAFAMCACDEEDPIIYKGPAFAEFGQTSAKLAAKAGEDKTGTYTVGLSRPLDHDITLNIGVGEGTTAVEGQDYTMSAKAVTIPAGQCAGQFSVTAKADALTPDGVSLVLQLTDKELTKPDVAPTEMTVNLSLFFEFDMEWLCGNWEASDYLKGLWGSPYEVSIENSGKIDEESGLEIVKIKNLGKLGGTIVALVNFEESVLIIPDGQYLLTLEGEKYYFWSIVDGYFGTGEDTYAEVTYKGISINSYGVISFPEANGYLADTQLRKAQ